MNLRLSRRCASSAAGPAQRSALWSAPCAVPALVPWGCHGHGQPCDRRASSYSASTSGRGSCSQAVPRWSRCRLAARCSKQLAVYQRPQAHESSSSPSTSTSSLADGHLAFISVPDTCICTHGHEGIGSTSISNGSASLCHTPHLAANHEAAVTVTPGRVGLVTLDHRLLAQIAGARSNSQLLAVLTGASRTASLGWQHLRAALEQVVALSTSEQEHQQQHTLQQRQQQRERQQVLSLVCEELLQCSHQLSAQQLVSTTCTLASLRHGHAELTGRLAQAAAAQSDALTAPQCAQLVWALGRLHHLSRAAVDPAVAATLLDWPEGSSKAQTADLDAWVSGLYGCALLRQPPPAPWLQQALVQVHNGLETLPQARLPRVLWSLAVLGCDPGRAWLQRVLLRLSGRMELGSGAQVASVLCSLAAMQHAPDALWMSHFLWHVQRLFKRSTPRDLQLIAWSLARLQYRPQAAWVQGFVRRLVRLAAYPAGSPEQEGAALRPQHVAVCFWALAKLQVRPPSKHLREVTELLRPHLSAASCQDLAYLLWSFQHFNFLPGPSWMADAQVAMHARLGQFDVASTIMALTALKGYSKVSPAASRMGMRNEVDSQLVSLLCTRLELLCCERGAQVSLRSCLSLVLTLGKLQAPISRDLHGYLLQQASKYLDDVPARKLSAVAWSLCKLAAGNGDSMQLRGSSQLQLLPRIEQLLLDYNYLRSPICAVKDLLQLASGFAAVSYRPADKLLGLHEACAVRLAKQGMVRASVASMLLQAYSQLGYEPHALCKLLCGMSMQAMEAAQLQTQTQGLGQRHTASAADQQVAQLNRTVAILDSSAVTELAGSSTSGVSTSLPASLAPAAASGPGVPVGSWASSRPHAWLDTLIHYVAGLSAVSFHPPSEWLQQHEACVVALAQQGELRARAVEALAHCYSRLGYDPRGLRSELSVVRFGHLSFRDKAEACDYFAELLRQAPEYGYHPHGFFPKAEEHALRALLRHHPDAAAKAGGGVAGFRIKLLGNGIRSLAVTRPDGTVETFSYVKCITAAFTTAASLSTYLHGIASSSNGKHVRGRW